MKKPMKKFKRYENGGEVMGEIDGLKGLVERTVTQLMQGKEIGALR